MLTKLHPAVRAAALRSAARRCARPFSAEAAAAPSEEAGLSPAGIDRSAPLYAPSFRREWKHGGYTNVVHADDPAKWKEWEDLPAPYKYYHVKVDPADVENEGMVWKLANNWKTAIPLMLGLSIPLFAFDVVVIDSHMELAAIFWASVAMTQANFGQAIRDSISEESEETKAQLLKAEGEYFGALEGNIEVHKRATALPKCVELLNTGKRQLLAIEAEAATRRNRAAETAKLVEALDYLVMTSASDEASADSGALVAAQNAADETLRTDKAAQQASIADAIACLKTDTAPADGNTVEAIFTKALAAYKASPPKPDPAIAKAVKEHKDEIFVKRFGFHVEGGGVNPLDFERRA